MFTAATFLGAWSLDRSVPAHRRLSRLLGAAGEAGAGRDDTLGERNRLLLRMHRELGRGPLEACVKCPGCGVDNELTVPVDAMLSTPAGSRDERVTLRYGRHRTTFRLPRMSDIDAAAASSDVRSTVLERCRVAGDSAELQEVAMERLGRRFEVLDPLASVEVRMECSGCGTVLAASVDVAGLVAHEIDTLVESLYRDVDRLARAYGWSEAAILSLPPERRRRYVAMAGTHGAGPRIPGRT
jgi:hypothetical protein